MGLVPDRPERALCYECVHTGNGGHPTSDSENISEVLSPGVNRLERDVDHLHLVALSRMSGTC